MRAKFWSQCHVGCSTKLASSASGAALALPDAIAHAGCVLRGWPAPPLAVMAGIDAERRVRSPTPPRSAAGDVLPRWVGEAENVRSGVGGHILQ